MNATQSLNVTNLSTTNIYLFLDGAQYLRINVTQPFLAIVPTSKALAQVKPIPVAKWDIIDWIMVLMIIFGFFYGIVAILDHLGLVDMQTVCVRWKKAKVAYANANYSFHDGIEMVNDDDEDLDDGEPGRFIPSSMGGWTKYSPRHPTRLLFHSKQRSTPTKLQKFPLLKGSSRMEEDNDEEYDPYHDDNGPDEGRGKMNRYDGKRNLTSRSLSMHGAKDPDSVDIPDLSFSSPIALPASANIPSSTTVREINEGIMT
jgi:hypothetical protein